MKGAIPLFAVLAALLPPAAWAQDCGTPINRVQMTRDRRGLDHVPVSINGTARTFLFDTGAGFTSISKKLAGELNLSVEASNRHMHDMNGNVSSQRAQVREFGIGHLWNRNFYLPVLSPLREEGLYGPDYLRLYDVEMDFGTDRLTFFAHCPGRNSYGKSGAMASFPIGRDGFFDNKLMVPVTLDGINIDAVMDSGASASVLRADIAQEIFGVTPGEPGTPRRGVVNGDPDLPVYTHRFKNLGFAGVAIANPTLSIVSDAMAQKAGPHEHPIHAPQMILGMDVLRKLEVYLAFSEMKMYVTPAFSAQAAPAP